MNLYLHISFIDINQNNNEQYLVERGGFLRPSYNTNDIVVEEIEEIGIDEMSPTPASYYYPKNRHPPHPKPVFVPRELQRRPPKENQRYVPHDLTTPELPIYFSEYFLTEPDEESTPVTPPGGIRPLPVGARRRPDSSEKIGRLLRAKTPQDIAYSWKEFDEGKKPVAEKLLLYKTEKEERMLQNNPEQLFADDAGTQAHNGSRNSSRASSRSSTASDFGQTMEDYIHNVNQNKTDWTSEDHIGDDEQKRIRRKLLDGSYPNFTVKEKKLPKLLR